MLDAIEAWCNKERPVAEVPIVPGPSRCRKAVSVGDLESVFISFALEDDEILFEQDGDRFQVYSLASP